MPRRSPALRSQAEAWDDDARSCRAAVVPPATNAMIASSSPSTRPTRSSMRSRETNWS